MKYVNFYFDSFKGLSKEIWYLSLVTLINRAGTMVIPFLSLYLTKDMGFTMPQVGWILTSFGLGSVVGSWLGGQLVDRIGHYKVMVMSLFATAIGFVMLQYMETIYTISLGIFFVMLVADAFRPAIFTSINAYSKPENTTRSVTLIRLAINLGFSAGPAVGGLIITTLSYGGLFWVDGVTCALAGLVLLYFLNPKTAKEEPSRANPNPKSVWNDTIYLIFIGGIILFGLTFVQYFSVMPVFYASAYQLSEYEIGLLLGMNGLVIFLLEMPLIKYLEEKSLSVMTYVIWGTILTGLSFLVLNLFSWVGILVIGMLFMTIGEMIAFPFTNKFALDRAKNGKMGAYMALYSISFSISHIFGHNGGMNLVNDYGYFTTWNIMAGMLVFAIILFISVQRKVQPLK